MNSKGISYTRHQQEIKGMDRERMALLESGADGREGHLMLPIVFGVEQPPSSADRCRIPGGQTSPWRKRSHIAWKSVVAFIINSIRLVKALIITDLQVKLI